MIDLAYIQEWHNAWQESVDRLSEGLIASKEDGLTVLILGVVFHLLILCLLGAVAITDARTQEIPNRLNLLLLGCGVLSLFIWPQITLLSHLIGLVCISVPMGAIALLAPGSFGMGDVKLMGACGLLLGWERILVALLIGIVIGGLQGVYFICTHRKSRKEHFAFGPALCIGISIALFAGRMLFDSYLALLV